MSRAPIESRGSTHQPLGMPAARFLRDYWQKHPLLIRNAFPDFMPPLSPNELAGLACEPEALARIVLCSKAESLDSGLRASRGPGMTKKTSSSFPRKRDKFVGNEFGQPKVGPTGKVHGRTLQSSDFEQWKVHNGPFSESDFVRLPKSHWTLLVQDVDKWDEDVAALLSRFDFLPSWRIDDVMVSYATDGGGVGAHVDQYDVFLLQGAGQRRWRISIDPHAPRDFRDDVELKLLREFHPTHDWTLAPGDMLYLPPDVPHEGVAIGECLTFSIGMRAPSSAELLVAFAEELAARLTESQRYADPDLHPVREIGEIDAAALHCARTALGPAAQMLDAQAFADFFGRFITAYRARAAEPSMRKINAETLARALPRSRFERDPWSRFAWRRTSRGAVLYVSGEQYACPLAWARALCGRERMLDGTRLAALPARAAGVTLLAELINAGSLIRRRR